MNEWKPKIKETVLWNKYPVLCLCIDGSVAWIKTESDTHLTVAVVDLRAYGDQSARPYFEGETK